MKNTKIKAIICSLVMITAIFSVTIFNANESKGADQAAGALLLLTDVTLSAGTHAYADNLTGHYVATIIGTNRVLFPNTMPAGSYHIVICGQTPNGGYNYLANGFQYNGGEQSLRVTLKKGYCIPE